MTEPARIDRILIIHSEPEVRQAIEHVVRRVHTCPVAVREASSAGEAIQIARGHDPRIIFLDLGAERALTLTVARELRRFDRLIIGLFNPLVEEGPAAESEFLRQAVRSGIGDFVPLPPSDSQISEALSAAPDPGTTSHEGKAVAFFSHQGGVGTTTAAVNTALALRAANPPSEAMLLDANVQFGSAAAHLGIVGETDLALAIRELSQGALLTLPMAGRDPGLPVLPSPVDPADAERITPEELSRVLIELRRRYEIIVVDTAPVLDLLTLAVFDLSETIVIVTEGSAPTVAGTVRLLGIMDDLGFGDRVRIALGRQRSTQELLAPEVVADQIGRRVDYVVPFLHPVAVAAHRGVPALYEKQSAPFAEVMRKIAGDIVSGGSKR